MERVKCALCGSEKHSMVLTAEDYRFHTTDEKFNLVKCRGCGLVYVNPRPTKEEMSKFYPRDYYGKQNRMAKVIVKHLLYMKIRKIMSFRKKGRILDVGCGEGGFLLNFKERGWEAYGVDISEAACRLARAKLGRYIFNCELKDRHFPDSSFDVVTLNHVLEHMLNPNEELREVHRILKDDGILRLSTPNIDSLQFKISKDRWIGLDLPRHLCYYSPRTIKDILKRNGFNVINTAYPLLDFPLDFFHSLKVKWLDEKFKFLKTPILPFVLIASILIKLHPAWRGSIEITSKKLVLSQV
jgi:2-polyprenyl-3-methyl-5-hydroxy-6-metoxy-1,4-benzoquinol methylase